MSTGNNERNKKKNHIYDYKKTAFYDRFNDITKYYSLQKHKNL